MKKIIITIGFCIFSTIASAQVKLKYYTNEEVAAFSRSSANKTGKEVSLHKYDNAQTGAAAKKLHKYDNAQTGAAAKKLHKYDNAQTGAAAKKLHKYEPTVALTIKGNANPEKYQTNPQGQQNTNGLSNNLNYDGKNQKLKN